MDPAGDTVHDNQNPQVLFSWKSPLRPFIHRSPQIVRFYLAVTLLTSILVFIFGDKILLLPLWTLLFIFYVFTVTPPGEVSHKITSFGVETAGGATLRWEILDHFYFTRRFGYDVLTLVTHEPYAYYAYIVIPDEEVKRKITLILSEHIIYQEKPRENFTDRAISWLSQFVPDDPRNHTPLKEEHLASSQG